MRNVEKTLDKFIFKWYDTDNNFEGVSAFNMRDFIFNINMRMRIPRAKVLGHSVVR